MLKLRSRQNFSVISGAGMGSQNTKELFDVNQHTLHALL